MPIYEYECTQCKKIEEVIQNFSDEPLDICPSCSGKLRKLISHSSFHLKGSGWYVTDYAGKSGSSSAPTDKSEGSANKTSEGKESGKSDSTAE